MSSRTLVAAIALALIVWAVHLEAWAGVTKPIRFAPGASSGTVSGAVVRGERDVYTLAARKGQHMEVRVTSPEDNAVFQILAPGKDQKALQGAGDGDDARTWNGPLPSSGTYRIVVGGTRGNATYKMTVTIR